MDSESQFEQAGGCRAGLAPYTIRSGDTFYLIAARNGISVQTLIDANPGVNPNRLMIGQVICIPAAPVPPPTLVTTPCCALLQPVFANLPPVAEIPIGGVLARAVAMSTRAFTVTATPLPGPGMFGNYDAYIAVLNLFRDGDPRQPESITVRLVPSGFGTQPVVWAGSTISTGRPVVGETVEVRPFNTATGVRGPVLLRGDLGNCKG